MKNIYISVLCLLLASTIFAQNGVIKVKVIDEQKLNLPGANVSLDDKKFNAVSNTSGTAVFYNIPAGKHTLTISYLGYKDYTQTINSTGTVSEFTVSLESGVNVLKGVIVLGDRLKGQSKALTQQKTVIILPISSAQIRSVVFQMRISETLSNVYLVLPCRTIRAKHVISLLGAWDLNSTLFHSTEKEFHRPKVITEGFSSTLSLQI